MENPTKDYNNEEKGSYSCLAREGDALSAGKLFGPMVFVLLLISGVSYIIVEGGETYPDMARETRSSSGKTIIVAKDGTGNYTTIQRAVEMAGNGDTIRVYDGEYYDSVIIIKTLTLVGNGSANTILNGNNTLDHQHLFDVNADGCSISGFMFKNGSPHHEYAGIGLYSRDNIIFNNTFYSCTQGIYLATSINNTIHNNNFTYNHRGIRAEFSSSKNTIRDNLFNRTYSSGITWRDSNNLVFINNTIKNTYTSAMSFLRVHNTTIVGNSIVNNSQYGLTFSHCKDMMVIHNNLSKNQIGFRSHWNFEDSRMYLNTFSYNDEGIRILANLLQPKIDGKLKNVSIFNNNINGNRFWGVNYTNNDPTILNITNNWWGDTSGPYDPVNNPAGKGDNITGNVTYKPWLFSEARNRPPKIETVDVLNVTEDELYRVVYEVSDLELDPLNWNISFEAPWLEWNETTKVLSGTPNNTHVGIYNIMINVSDDHNGFDLHEFQIEVINVDPEIIGNDDPVVLEHEHYHTDYNTTDQDHLTNWSFSTNASFLHFDYYQGLLSGIPENEDVGHYWVNVSVDDGNGGSDHHNFTLDVRNVNDHPVVMDPPANISFEEDTVYQMDLDEWFYDIDDRLLFQLTWTFEGMAQVKMNGTMTLTPDRDWSGSGTLSILAWDGDVGILHEMNVTVTPVNDRPTDLSIFISSGDLKWNGSQPATAYVTDVDVPYGDVLNFTWTSNRTGHIGHGNSLDLDLPGGHHEVTCNVSDLVGEWVSTSVDIFIIPEVENKTEPSDDNITIPDDDPPVNDTAPDDDNSTVIDDDLPDDDNSTVIDDDVDPVDDDDKQDMDRNGNGSMDVARYLLIFLILLIIISIVFLLYRVTRRKNSDIWEEE